MPDGIRSIDGEGLIPMPRGVLRAKGRARGASGQPQRDFEEQLGSDPDGQDPSASIRGATGDDQAGEYAPQPRSKHPQGLRKSEGLGGDLDLLA